MADSNDPNPASDPSDPARRRFYNDIRDDYDEEFGRVRTPAEIAKKRLQVPGILHVVIGGFFAAGTIVGAVATVLDAYDGPYHDDTDLMFGVILALVIVVGGGILSWIAIAGGLSMMQLKRRRLALVAAFIVTGLSLAGPYGILFYPFGIWALIVLYNDSVKKEFGSPQRVARASPGIRVPNTTRLLLVAGEIGCPIMLFVCGMVIWDASVYTRFWTTSEIVWSVSITILVAGMFAAMIVVARNSKKRVLAKSLSKPIQPSSTNE